MGERKRREIRKSGERKRSCGIGGKEEEEEQEDEMEE